MPVNNTGPYLGLSVGLVFAVAFFGVGCWMGHLGTQGLEQWQRCLSNRTAPAGHGWEQITSLNGPVELGHVNGTANGTTTAMARNTTHCTTHATADDTTRGSASGTAVGNLDGTAYPPEDATEDATAVGDTDLTAHGAASGPH